MSRLPVRFCCLVASLVLSHGAFGEASPSAPLPPALAPAFPLSFFPELSELSRDLLLLEGLAARFPGRVLKDAPAKSPKPEDKAATLIVTLPRDIHYLRVYQLEEAAGALREALQADAVILDLRFLHGDWPAALGLLQLFGQTPEALQWQGDDAPSSTVPDGFDPVPRQYPAVVLVNHRTAGALEAALQALQGANHVLTVGQPTAGATGRYHTLPELQGFWVINGEALAAGYPSLLGTGLTPEVVVRVSPAEDLAGYQRVEAGFSPVAILEVSLPSLRTPDSTERSSSPESPDRNLQRAVEVLVALQTLGRLP